MSQPRAGRLETRQQVVVSGQVSSSHTGKPLANVHIRLTPDRLDRLDRLDRDDKTERRTTTSSSGLFYFCNLPAGDYKITAEMPGESKRLSSAAATAEVSYDSEGTVTKRAFLDFVLSPTRVEGRVISKATKKGVALAQVRIKGSGEFTHTDLEGRYVLAGIEASANGDRVVEAVSQGYKAAVQRVRIAEPGGIGRADFPLVKESEKDHTGEA